MYAYLYKKIDKSFHLLSIVV